MTKLVKILILIILILMTFNIYIMNLRSNRLDNQTKMIQVAHPEFDFNKGQSLVK